MQVYCDKEGVLEIGTAKVSDVISARNSGSNVASQVKSYLVSQGLNTIDLSSLEIGNGETIILGGNNTTVSIYSYSGINVDDEMGVYTTLNGQANTTIYEETALVKSKLVINVQVQAIKYVSTFNDNYSSFISTKSNTIAPVSSTFYYKNLSLYANKEIAFVEFKVSSVPNIDNNQYITISLLNVSGASVSLNKTYKFYAKQEDLGSDKNNVNKLVKFYPQEKVLVGANQTIGFYSSTDSVKFWFASGVTDSTYNGFYTGLSNPAESPSDTLCFNAYSKNCLSLEEHINNLNSEETVIQPIAELRSALAGKRISILGDSISTYNGQSQCGNPWYGSTVYNSTLDINETWWRQVMDKLDLTLSVNNAVGGRNMVDSIGSISSLDDNGAPDIVIVFLGTNDSHRTTGTFSAAQANFASSSPNYDTFANGYYALLSSVKSAYSNSIIIAVDLYKGSQHAGVMAEIASYFGIEVAKLSQSPLNADWNNGIYNYFDEKNSREHPNALGMDFITDAVIEALKKCV